MEIYRVIWKVDNRNKGVLFVNAPNGQYASQVVSNKVKSVLFPNSSAIDFAKVFSIVDIRPTHTDRVLEILNNAIRHNPAYFSDNNNI